MKYQGYRITRDKRTGNYHIQGFAEVAVNLETAKRWIRCEIASSQMRQLKSLKSLGLLNSHGIESLKDWEDTAKQYPV